MRRVQILVCLALAALTACGPVSSPLPGPEEFLASKAEAVAASDIFDWPMGGMQGGVLVPGYNIRVMQNYGNVGLEGPRAHAAADLALNSTDNAAGAPVYAAANGTIRCVINAPNPGNPASGYPGAVIVIEHVLSNGSTVYSMYGHLNNVSLTAGTVVTRGQQLSTVWLWNPATNSHLHFEVRNWLNWYAGGCAGPGYAEGSLSPDSQGWRDPIDFHYQHRPDFPGTTVSDITQNVRSSPAVGGGLIGSVPAGTRVNASQVVPAQDGSDDWWYRVQYDGVNWGYMAGYQDFGWGGDLYMTELRRDGAPPPTCPYASIQTRVQPNASTPWSQTLTITQGQSFSVATFQNGSGALTTCCTTITVTGPNGWTATPNNLGAVTPPAAGTYTVRGACGSLAEIATVTVNPAPPACPYGSLQMRVQPNASTPWSQALTVAQGQSFTVGSFQNGSGQLTSCCTTIRVTGPGGYLATPPNLGSVMPGAAGTYQVTATCGTLTDTAVVTVTSGSVSIALGNPTLETQTSAQFGPLLSWGPNGAWATHAQFPKAGNGGLGARFGYYSAGTAETVGQLLTTRFEASKTYTFRSWAQGGGDNTGVVPYQLGYAATDGNLGSFVPLATAAVAVGADWQLRSGVSYTTPASGGAVGKQIIVRLGNSSSGGQSDIWFDSFELFRSP